MSCLQTMEVFKNDISTFKQFLSDFNSDHNGPITEDDPLPFRLFNYYLTEGEVEAEVLEWTFQYLSANQCPNLLACILSRHVTDDVLTWDLGPYLEPVTPGVKEVYDGEEIEQSPRDDTPQIEVMKLARAVFSKLHAVVAQWKQEGLPTLPLPSRSHQVSVHAIKNTRRKMEDRHVVLPYAGYLLPPPASRGQETKKEGEPPEDLSYFAVFDGHAGVDTAVYVATHLHRNILCHSAAQNNLTAAIHSGVQKTSDDFASKAKRESLRSGSTGVWCILQPAMLTLGWVGDSQIMLVRDGEPECIMEPHKPERMDERKRIEDLGGCVINMEGTWRVNGMLSVSRAFGDVAYQPFICASPDVATIPLTGTEDYIVLACDGLFDMVSHDLLATTIYDHLHRDTDNDRAGVAKRLTELAKEHDSSDNISVVVIFLREEIGVPASRRRQQGVGVESGVERGEGVMETSQDSNLGDVGNGDTERDVGGSLGGCVEGQKRSGSPKDCPDSRDSPAGSYGNSGVDSHGSSCSSRRLKDSFSRDGDGDGKFSKDNSDGHDVSDASSKALKGESPNVSTNQNSGNMPSNKLQTRGSEDSPVMFRIRPGYESSSNPEASPVLFKIKAAYGSQSPLLSTTNGSKKVLVDIPALEQLKISSESAESAPKKSPLIRVPIAPLCDSESFSSSTSTVSQPILPRAPVCISDRQSTSGKSDASSADYKALMNNTATKCLSNRRAKRSKNPRRKNLRELRRTSKDKLSPLSPVSLPKSPISPGAIAHRTSASASTPPSRSRHASSETSTNYLRTASLRLAATGSTGGGRGDHLIEMLTGCSPQVMRKVTDIARTRWTVAVEIESGNGMFSE